MPSPKDGTNDQWGLVTSTGDRGTAGPPFSSMPEGSGGAPSIDPNGQQWVRMQAAPPPFPGLNTPWQNSSAALAVDVQVFDGESALEQITGIVAAASDDAVNYVQVYDLAAAPGVADVPVQTLRVVGSQVWAWSPQRWAMKFGVRLSVSSSPASFVASTDTAFFNALGYEP